ncbi:hypothetical protein A9Q86_11365 [Flavobacteriales bacterium 33_180_T64]|nr:hypothetical protein A9Q86_11365 [Flavobacteriales bacterium 33_180_T64]
MIKMKSIILFVLFSFNFYCFSQNRELKKFSFQNNEITYSRIDYSKYKIAQFFISMYSEDDKYDSIEQNAYTCLLNKERLYHTLYFFIRVPKEIIDPKVKNEFFTEFISHLKKEEKMVDINLYLNFDTDYSTSYRKEQIKTIKRIKTDVTSQNICKMLSIR